jgi:adenylate cyclase
MSSARCGEKKREAKADQILVSPRVAGAVDNGIQLVPVGTLTLKGFLKPVEAFNVVGLKVT